MKNVYKITTKKDEPTYKIINGDNVLGLKKIPTRSIDLIATDSPYAINFAGNKWDNDVVSQEALGESFRVLKHGAFMLCFASSRTDHIVKRRAEQEGFIVKDTIMYVYGTGQIHTYKYGREIESELNKLGKTNANLVQEHLNHSIKLRPAYEPCIVLQKPYRKGQTHAQSIICGGCGSMDIYNTRFNNGDKLRYPSNFIHDNSEQVLEQFATTGKSGVANYFYYPKPSVEEKNYGCEHLPKRGKNYSGSISKNKNTKPQANFHDTVKPVALMKHLIEIFCPSGGVVLDIFNGSSSTGVAAIQSKYSFIGIELCPDYCQIGLARMNKHLSDINHPTKCEFEVLLTTEEAA